ncbi:hypothetical protein FN846DRAFT_903284 [Sphaerosporella brunnea]|uniref:Uncharacterized protein n=1 Tax=Sphaerosporella brunnea TaxID=1250544 RepID=A0A5J5F7D4_9PEZI|nr:hypothetical protein FN846DRAFT_903284 [Sphaerosporella brunnea]
MSQDLLSEFDAFYQAPAPQPAPAPPPPTPPYHRGHTPSHSFSHSNYGGAHATTFDDLLGIMDTGLISNPRPPRPQSLHLRKAARDDPYSSGLFDVAPQRGTATSDLFTRPPPPHRGHAHSQSLIDIGPTTTISTPQRRASRNQHLADLKTLSLPSSSIAEANDDDDDFGDFVSSPKTTPDPQKAFQFPPPPPQKRSNRARFSTLPGSIALSPFSSFPPKPAPPPPPQQQFPPVAALLQTLTPLFLLPESHLLLHLKGLPFPLRQRILAHPSTKSFLEAICELGRVAGRIIAGRKRRRPMRPTSIKATGNLKQQKEEREVKETVRIWREGMGRLKAAMGEGVPDMVEDYRAVFRGAETCKLCKLGRGEAVPAFKDRETGGKWELAWGGHRGCKAFWERHGPEVGRGY